MEFFPYLLFCCLGIATGALAIEFLHPVDGAIATIINLFV